MRLVGAVLAGAAALVALATSVVALWQGGEPTRPGAVSDSLHVRYRAVLRYDATVWKAAESVVVARAVLARVMQAGVPRPRALGSDWRYRGTLGLPRSQYVYVRRRSLTALDDAGDEPSFRPIAVPAIHRGRVRLVPGPQSTMELTGPAHLVNETSPEGTRHTAGGTSTIVVDLARELDDRERSVVEVFPLSEDGDPWWGPAFDSVLGLVGLAITTAVAAAVTFWVQRRLTRRRTRRRARGA